VEAVSKRLSWSAWNPIFTIQTITLVCVVAALSYLAPKLEGAAILHPRTVWPLWPDCALLVSVMLLVRQKLWLALVPAAFAGFVLYDLQAGVPLRSIAWFIPADTAEVLIAALCLRYLFAGPPQLNSLRNLTKYFVCAALLAPFAAAFLSAPGIGGNYWTGWRICFFSEVLAFVTLTPAVLSWANGVRAWWRKPFIYHLEGAALFAGLALFSYLSLAAFARSSSPALLYSLLPFLLWSALRFGSMGASSAVIVVGFCSIWGVLHNRGPFIEAGQLGTVFSMQLFLIFTATPFMILAALAEERNETETALRKSEERLRLAVQAGRMYAFEWDAATDGIVRSGVSRLVLGMDGAATGQQTFSKVHPDDQRNLSSAVAALSPQKPSLRICHRMLSEDGGTIWVERASRAYFDERGRLARIVGTVADVTDRKKAEEALHQREEELLQAQRVAQVGSWQWDARTGVVTWSKELCRIAGHDPDSPPPAYEQQQHLYSPESWERLKSAVAEALQNGTPYQLDLEMIRPDGSSRWITDRGEVVRDAQHRIAWLRGTAQDITERKRAEEALRVSEEKFRTVFRNAAIGMVIVSLDGRFLAANEAFCECLGYTEDELLEKTVESITLAEDWPAFSTRLREALERGTGFQRVEKHCLHKSGRVITTESSASLIRSPSGEPRYFVGEVLDVTQRKLAEEALASVSRRLIEAHEAERARVARELHDDISQRVAFLALNLRRLKHGLPASAGDAGEAIEKASSSVSELGKEIQALSHRLHSSKLEYLGLVAACQGFCRELSQGQDVVIDFHSEDIPNNLPREIGLCLFRVLQESLQNAVKHSGAKRFEVSLKVAGNEIRLSVQDSGVGFDPEEAIRGRGLGLTSMKERLKLVEGELFVDSRPQRGTIIQARVPFDRRVRSTAGSG
jgi:PAS domain S-box-containing protein